MPLFGPMLLLILENVSAYALIQDYALIRTLKVITFAQKLTLLLHWTQCEIYGNSSLTKIS